MLRALSSTNAVTARMDLPPSFVCVWRTGRYGSIWVDLAGELDLAASAELARTLRETQARSTLVVLDLRELTFMDIVSAHVIVDAGISARKAARGLIVARGSTQVDMVFTLTGASEQVELFDLDPEQCPPALSDSSGRLPPCGPPRQFWRDRGPCPPPETSRRDGTRRVNTDAAARGTAGAQLLALSPWDRHILTPPPSCSS
jgi:anti-anti-sigma factor